MQPGPANKTTHCLVQKQRSKYILDRVCMQHWIVVSKKRSIRFAWVIKLLFYLDLFVLLLVATVLIACCDEWSESKMHWHCTSTIQTCVKLTLTWHPFLESPSCTVSCLGNDVCNYQSRRPRLFQNIRNFIFRYVSRRNHGVVSVS